MIFSSLAYCFKIVLILAVVILAHVNNRGTDVQVTKDGPKVFVGTNFKRFNPSVCNLNGTTFVACRHSSRNICPSKFMPPVFPMYDEYTTETTSYILLKTFDYSKSDEPVLTKHLDTSASGFGHYEDARLLVLGQRIVVVCTKYLYHIARICIFIIDPKTLATQGSIEYWCKSQSQKNWIPRASNTSLLLYASLENSILHELPEACSIKGHHTVFIGPCKIGRWRGSSGIIETSLGTLAMVHRRTKVSYIDWVVKERFLPHYIFCFARFDGLGVKEFSRDFTAKVKGFSGFVYVSGFQEIGSEFEIFCGITDCYAVQFKMHTDFVNKLFEEKDLDTLHLDFEPSAVF